MRLSRRMGRPHASRRIAVAMLLSMRPIEARSDASAARGRGVAASPNEGCHAYFFFFFAFFFFFFFPAFFSFRNAAHKAASNSR